MKRLDKVFFISTKHWLKIVYWLRKRNWKIKTLKDKDAVNTIPMWTRLEIELQSDCNRDCCFCPRYGDRSGVRKDSNGNHVKKSMPTWKIFDIIDQAKDLGYNGSMGFKGISEKFGFKGSIGFHRLSEPFLDKRYIEIASYAKEKGMKISDNTNGDLLKKNPKLCSKLDGLLDSIIIGLYDYKNTKERNEQVRFWENRFKKTKVAFSLAAEFPKIRQNTKLYDKKLVTHKIRNYPCYATTGLRIRYDGNVSLCCQDDQCVFDLGNVFDTPIKDIWWSKRHIEIVNSLKAPGNRILYPLCRDCVIVTL